MGSRTQKRPNVYRKEFIRNLAENADISELEADILTTKFFVTLTETLLDQKSICFPDFGIFELHATSERMGRNPRTMEEHIIPAGVKPTFRASKALFVSINEAVRNQQEKAAAENDAKELEDKDETEKPTAQTEQKV